MKYKIYNYEKELEEEIDISLYQGLKFFIINWISFNILILVLSFLLGVFLGLISLII